jgi:tetratricopeptide (TPR) repeat protein
MHTILARPSTCVQLAQCNTAAHPDAQHGRLPLNRHTHMCTRRAGKYASAIEDYTAAICLDPTSVPAYTNRAAAHLQLEQWQAAVKSCNEALRLVNQSAGGVQQLPA